MAFLDTTVQVLRATCVAAEPAPSRVAHGPSAAYRRRCSRSVRCCGDVEHQNRTTDRLCRSHPDTSGHVDHLIEVGVGRLFVRAVAERQRIVQRLYEGSLRGDLFVIADGRDLLATSLRAKEQIGGDDVPTQVAKSAGLWRRLGLLLLRRPGL